MKALLAVLTLFSGCYFYSQYQRADCVKLEYSAFYKDVCDGASVRIDTNYANKRYIGQVEPAYVKKGCPERFNFHERSIVERVTCPKSLKYK